ncbi:hypothetical protein [Nocardioides sp. B-3]|uniref:hypothetical protein n=1 Tax=Nocardioides sp. B-3 TaxID=2895565 RepID=UPI0021526789|nr:hypothetical protein [Nocardioides sp. B-3]UUZ59110.1 hypothetical protein LP418_24725 [Nocardioides sp. B-3]
MLADAEVDEGFLLGLAAEGTRSKTDYWKSGFYRISQKTGIPVTLAYLDSATRTVGWGPTFDLTGDVKADMDRVREFYADKTGIKPDQGHRPAAALKRTRPQADRALPMKRWVHGRPIDGPGR